MKQDNVLGELEHLVLLATVRLGKGAYSVAIVRELENRAGRTIAAAAVFITLQRLEEKGFARSETSVRGEVDQRERRYFSVTPHGVNALRAAREQLFSLWRGIEPIVGGADL